MASFQLVHIIGFSDGTLSGAEQNSDKGGACAADPPLRLTIIIAGILT